VVVKTNPHVLVVLVVVGVPLVTVVRCLTSSCRQ